jgi:catechol 2,3-dioxygenase-like lactoylglutathione lyase family enzyme
MSRSAGPATLAIPILYSTDLDRTAAFYGPLGLKIIERHDEYLVMGVGAVELHFTSGNLASAPGQAFLHVPDAGKLWKELQGGSVGGVGPLEDHLSGLREFLVTDPDGNRIRVGSPTPRD